MADPTLRIMTAKYHGHCAGCGEAGAPGDTIGFDTTARVSYHEACGQASTEPAPFHIEEGQGYGGTPYRAGESLRADVYHDGVETNAIVTVVRSGQRHYREDGMSFGVGDDAGYIYWADVRIATEEEAEPVRAREQLEAARQQQAAGRQEARRQLSDLFIRTGETVDATQLPRADADGVRQVVVYPRRGTVYDLASRYLTQGDTVWEHVYNADMDPYDFVRRVELNAEVADLLDAAAHPIQAWVQVRSGLPFLDDDLTPELALRPRRAPGELSL